MSRPDHGLFCDCADCESEWARQEVYDATCLEEGDVEDINYEDEKARDRDLGHPQGAGK